MIFSKRSANRDWDKIDKQEKKGKKQKDKLNRDLDRSQSNYKQRGRTPQYGSSYTDLNTKSLVLTPKTIESFQKSQNQFKSSNQQPRVLGAYSDIGISSPNYRKELNRQGTLAGVDDRLFRNLSFKTRRLYDQVWTLTKKPGMFIKKYPGRLGLGLATVGTAGYVIGSNYNKRKRNRKRISNKVRNFLDRTI